MTAPVAQALTNASDLLPGLVIPKTDADGTVMAFDDVLSALFADDGTDGVQPDSISPASQSLPQWPTGVEDLEIAPNVADDERAATPGTAPAVKTPPASGGHTPNKAVALRLFAAAAYAEAAALTKEPTPDARETASDASNVIQTTTPPPSPPADDAVPETDLNANNTTTSVTDAPDAPRPIHAQDAPNTPPAQRGTKTDEAEKTAVGASVQTNEAEPQSAQQAALPVENKPQADQVVPAVAPITEANTALTGGSPNANTATVSDASQAKPAPAPAPVVAAEAAPIVTASLSAVANDTKPGNSQGMPAKTSPRADSAKMKLAGASPVRSSDEKNSVSSADNATAKTQDAPRPPSPPSHPGNGQSLPAPAPQPHTATPHAYASIDMSNADLSMAGQATPTAAAAPLRFELSTLAGAPTGAADMDGLALRIAAKSAAGESEFTVRLDPPSLGRIEVTLNVNSQGAAQASLSADKPHTLELLQRDAPALERALKDAGLDLTGGLSFSLKSDGQPGDWRNAQTWNQGNSVRIDAADAANSGAMAVPAAAFIANGWSGNARLDITV